MRTTVAAAILTVGLLAPSGFAKAQAGVQLRGRVLDANTGTPVNQAIVRVPAVGKYTLTNPDGRFRIDGVGRGFQNIVVVNLGYGELATRLNVQADSFYILSIEPQPIQLAPVVVVTSRFMDQRAESRVQGTSGEPIAWQKWDRDKILASGRSKPVDFLTKTAHISIRKCSTFRMPSNRLCVGIPFDGLSHPQYGGNASWKSVTAARDAVQPGHTPGRGNGMGAYMAKYHRDPAAPPIPVNSKIPSVYLDDAAITLEALSIYKMEDMHRVEAYGNRGERQIRFYTSGYLRLVEAGLITPSSISVRQETFEFPVPWQDSLHAPRIRR